MPFRDSAATWNRYLRDNLLDAGEIQTRFHIDPFLDPNVQTNWSTINLNGNHPLGANKASTGAQNATISWDVTLTAGTWKIAVRFPAAADQGIITVNLNGSSQGTIDTYGTGGGPVNWSYGEVTATVTTTGRHTVELKMATKNGSSTSYYGRISRVTFYRTAMTATWTNPMADSFYVGEALTSTILNRQLRDNLNARGEGQRNQLINVFSTPKTQKGWDVTTQNSVNSSYPYLQAFGTTGDYVGGYYISWDVPLTAGTWSLFMWARQQAQNGIMTVTLDGVTLGTLDWYAASAAFAQQSIAGWTVSESDVRELRLESSTKTASSTGFNQVLASILLRRTA